MTQEEKQLLLIDLCSRLPYEVKGMVYAETSKGEYDMDGELIFDDSPFDVILDMVNTSTEELHVVAVGNEDTVDFIEEAQTWGDPYTIDDFKPYLRPLSSMTEEEKDEYDRLVMCNASWIVDDWLNKNHFDYRRLIEKGLALEASEGMYK